MKNFILAVLIFLSIAAPVFASGEMQFTELYRIEVYNKAGGQIAVSSDQGGSWETVGRVLYPCKHVNKDGYTASKWAQVGCVAASAVNAIHIKTDNNTLEAKGVVFSLVPDQMLNPPSYYNSFLSPDSSIYTNIKAGDSIFGGGYSPFVGNPVFTVNSSSELQPIPDGYVPNIGDIITVKVLRPVKYPREITFENRFGGLVKINYNGADEKVIAEVFKPVEGIGRFQGGQFAGPGRIRANHTGVIDVSTSPIGKVGGFQIIPSNHGMSPEMSRARLLTQWMVVGPTAVLGKALEGQPPLFSYFLQPNYSSMDLGESDIDFVNDLLGRYIVDVKLAGSNEWQPMPVISIDPDLRKPLPEWANSAFQKVTNIRILFPVEEH